MDSESLPNPLTLQMDPMLLGSALAQAVRSTLFSSGLSISPRRVNQIGSGVGTAFFDFYVTRDVKHAQVVGRQLAQEGLGPSTALSVTETLRKVCRDYANPLIDLIDAAGEFSSSFLEGYIIRREEILLEVQERTHRAHLAALKRQLGESGSPSPGE